VIVQDSEGEDMEEVPIPIVPLEPKLAVSEAEVNDFLRNEVAPDLVSHPTTSEYFSS
jgi:hypothetical protein